MPAAACRGYVEAVRDGEVIGWALDCDRPDEPVSVDICEGEQVLTRVTARLPRRDLAEAGIGTGAHGFAVRLPKGLFRHDRHVLTLRFADGRELVGSPIVVETDWPEAMRPPSAIRAFLDAQQRAARTGAQRLALAKLLMEAAASVLAQAAPPPDAEGPAPSAAPASFAAMVEAVRATYPAHRHIAPRDPDLSFIVAARDCFAALHACCGAILGAAAGRSFELVIVDDRSSDELVLGEALLGSGIKVFRTPSSLGPVKAFRAGAALATGRMILLVQPTFRIDADGLAAILDDATARGGLAIGRMGKEIGLLAVTRERWRRRGGLPADASSLEEAAEALQGPGDDSKAPG
ncbi:MAG: glycosyltransferase [Alsobacter sp.]